MNEDTIPFTKFSMDVDIDNNERRRMQEHGIWPSRTLFGKRKISIEGDLLAADYAPLGELRLALMSALVPTEDNDAAGQVEIQFTGMPEPFVAEVNLDGYPELPIEAVTGAWNNFQLNLKTFDPWFLGKSTFTRTATTSLTPRYGRTYNKTYNYSYADSGFVGNIIQASNIGNWPSYPVVTFYGPGLGPEIWSGSNRLQFRSLFLDNGETLTVDFRDRTAIKNDGTDLYNTLTSRQWFKLPSGKVSPVELHWYLPGNGAKADIVWHNAWMV